MQKIWNLAKFLKFIKESTAYSTIQNQSQFDGGQSQIQQQSSVGQLPRGAVSRVEGPLFGSKQKTLLTM